MTLRRLTAADAVWATPLLQPAYRGLLTEEAVAQMITATDPPTVCIGDPDVPVFMRLIHYAVPPEFPVPGLGWGLMTQLADLHPLDLSEASITIDAQVSGFRPVIAEGLRLMRARGYGTRRVWAELPDVLAAAFRRNLFPGAGGSGRHIHMARLDRAHDRVRLP